MDIDECKYGNRCLNSDKCFRCFDNRLLKLPEDKQKKSYSNLKVHNTTVASADDSWKDLEQTVADKLNYVPTIKQARRSRMSGALEYETGDIVDEILHPECKERQGNLLKSGDRTISLSRQMLLKAKKECANTTRTMVLPFRFKNDDDIYAIFDMEDIAELITTQKALVMDNDIQSKEIAYLKEKIEDIKAQYEER